MKDRPFIEPVSPEAHEYVRVHFGEVPIENLSDQPFLAIGRPGKSARVRTLLKLAGVDVTQLPSWPITPIMEPTRHEATHSEEETPKIAVHILTVSRGPRTNTVGTRIAVTGESPVAALAEVLRNLPETTEAWWSPHTWERDRRSGRRWVAAAAVALDLDFHDAQGRHAEPPREARTNLRAALGNATGNLFHDTPRGARIVFVLERPCSDREAYTQAASGAAALVAAVLDANGVVPEAGQGGFAVDPTVKDFARFLYAPRAVVHGHARDAEVLVMREREFSLREIADLAPPPAKQPERTPVKVGEGARRFDDAVKRWNEDHAEDWGPPGRGECPACHHHGCFGRLPELPDKWSCFSSGPDGHGARTGSACGREGGSGHWFGDALDLEAFRRGETRLQIVRQDGYLAPPSSPSV